MSRNAVKVGTPVSVLYKIPRGYDLTGKTVEMDVYDETDTLVPTQSGVMPSVAGHRFRKSFTPNTEGQWSVELYVEETSSGDKFMTLVRDYSVGQYSIPEIGARLATIESKIDNLPDADADPPMMG